MSPQELSAAPNLAPRERDVLQLLVVEALTNPEIAAQLKIETDTAKEYIQRLQTKLHARNRVDIAVKAIQLGLVNLSELRDPRRRGLRKLTKREEDVLALLKEGLQAWEVGEQLGITKEYVLSIEQRIRRKWDVNSREEILTLARTYRQRGVAQQSHERPGAVPGDAPEGRPS